ncbi:MAG TPA: KTSC domain-containing protein [Chthoniobacterales bacterium]|nr:KTSC domain-containing protein [Chthoniobacterales bacterium]
MIPVRRTARLIVTAIALLTLGSAGAEEQLQVTSRITRQPVHSHALAAVGYSKRLHALEVEFVNGAIYRYSNVPPEIYRDLLGAPSKAQFYDENVRGHFPSVHVKPPRS